MSLDHSRIRAICFDIDGTLSDSDDQFVDYLAKRLRPVRFLFPRGDPRRFARRMVIMTETPGNFMLGLADRMGVDSPLARLSAFFYRCGLGSGSRAFMLVPGVRPMLEELQPRYPLGIVTARGAHTTRLFLDQFELNGIFACVASAQTCRHTKPYPDPIRWAAAQMSVTPEQCLMVGDTKVDIRAGRAAGSQTAGVLCGFGKEKDLRRAGADVILGTTGDLVGELME